MDILDRAQIADSNFRNQAIAQAKKAGNSKSLSRTRCLDCECVIPEARRIAAPGCERCVSCEEKNEILKGR